jgi:hypothetical protein
MIKAGMNSDEMLEARRTCDRPLCAKHRVNRGHMHFCSGKGCLIETVDFCPGHAATGTWFKPDYNPIGGPKRGA